MGNVGAYWDKELKDIHFLKTAFWVFFIFNKGILQGAKYK